MQQVKKYFQSVSFVIKHIFRFAPIESGISAIYFFISGALPYASAFFLGELVTQIISGVRNPASVSNIWYTVALYAGASALPGILGDVQSYVGRHRMSKLQVETELEIMKKRESIDIATYEDPAFQDLMQRTFRNGPNPIFQLSAAQLDSLRAVSSLVVGTIIALHFNMWIYLAVILAAIPSFITDIKYAGYSWSIWSKDSIEQRRFGDLRQHINGKNFLIETKLLQSGKKLMSWMRDILENFAKKQLALEKNRFIWVVLSDLLALAGFSLGLFLIVRGVLSGIYEVGTLVYMMQTLSNVRNSIGNFLSIVSGQYENQLIVGDMITFFNTKSVVMDSKNPTRLSLSHAPEIIFENVGFKYRSSDKWSLRNVNLIFKAGDNIGLVGNNGAGKTTLVKLLCRIYDPSEGRILINGVDLKEISTKEWWSYLAVMFQDYASYDFAVKDAIAISRPEKALNLTKVIEASKVSQSHEFIMDWENKYDEQLGVEFKGKEPSKGQRQKLSIAKILYRDGLVMILDEPTASVDAESEAKIFDSIENLPKDRTAILISHDFSTISQCDKIFVMDKGKLAEEGSHKDLMKMKGMYSELYNLQAKRFKK